MINTFRRPQMKGDGRYRRSPWHGDDHGHGRLYSWADRLLPDAEPVIDRERPE
jgi:hypothetical protein